MKSPAEHQRQLTMLDATCIMVGIVVGSGIFTSPSEVAKECPQAWMLLALWLCGGLASLLGALCFAELSTRYPEHGGTYAFLNRAYGPSAGLLFAWTDFWIVRPANAGAVALVLGRYANDAWPVPYGVMFYAIGGVCLATGMHLRGLHVGRWSQNALSIAKMLGLLLVIVAALAMTHPATAAPTIASSSATGLFQAFVLVMFTYGGWSDLSNVAAEVRDPSRNLLRSLVLGVTAITITYLAINGAAVYALGVERLGRSEAFATDLVEGLGGFGQRFVASLVIVCCFGSLVGVVFTGARVYHALGLRHKLFSWLGGWDARRSTPPQSLLAQAAITCALLALAGNDKQGFENLVVFAAPCYWGFTLLAALAVIVLRRQDTESPLFFRVPLHPLTPLAFAAICCVLVVSSVVYVTRHLSTQAWYTIVVIAAGLLLTVWTRERE